VVEEILYPAMEDFHIEYFNRAGAIGPINETGHSKFTLVGETTVRVHLTSFA